MVAKLIKRKLSFYHDKLILFSSVYVLVRDVCTGTNAGMTIVEDTKERKIQALKNRYENCQYVDGNLEITGLDSEEYYNEDLSFLNSIREVTGYVLIANVYAQNVTLENLTIIRGDTLFVPPPKTNVNETSAPSQTRGYSLFVSLNYRRESDSIGMRLLGLRNLTGNSILIILLCLHYSCPFLR